MNTLSAPLYSPAPTWTGRDDGPGPEHARWFSVVNRADSARVNLLGFASDEGVARNGGRQGAAAGPEAIRRALGSLAVHHAHALGDAGTITTQGEDLEGAQEALSRRVEELSAPGALTIVLGGGHETAFATHRGAYRSRGALKTINLDAHFDLRTAERATSGTPFKQIAQLTGEDFSYSVLGISAPNNTRALFDEAKALGAHTVTDEELLEMTAREAGALAAAEAAEHAAVHLSIDLDVLPAAVAPGVSAPAALGVALSHIRAMAIALARTGKLALVDVVELNPTYDVDGRTAKVAARLVADIASAHLAATADPR